MRVLELRRYPVKSLQGESLKSADVTSAGIRGDRALALFDVETGFGLTARRVPELLYASARMTEDGVTITLPDGSVASTDEALSEWLGRRVTLRKAAAPGERQYENPANFEDEAESVWEPFVGAGGAFHDEGGAKVSMVSTATLGSWDWRRFRTNVYLDGDGEDALVGSRVMIGNVLFDVDMKIPRCVMVTRPQPGGIERDLDVLRTINRDRTSCLSIGALVLEDGTVTVGDELIRQ